MKAKNITLVGKSATGDTALNPSIFGVDLRVDILTRVVNWQLAKRQSGTHKTKGRGEIVGGKKKPFRQKGTGSARQGSKNAPHMRGGGVAFGPVVRSHAYALPKKIRALGLKVALSSKQKSGKIVVLKNDDAKKVKTSDIAKGVSALGFDSVLIVYGAAFSTDMHKAAANVKHVDLLSVDGANVYDILRKDGLVITEDAVKKLEERFNG